MQVALRILALTLIAGLIIPSILLRTSNGACADGDPPVVSPLFRFVQISDTHITDQASAQVVSRAARDIAELPSAPAFVVHTGDIVDHPSDCLFDLYCNQIKAFSCPVHSVIGNHDEDLNQGKTAYENHLGARDYAFDIGPYHFIVLDSTKPDSLTTWGGGFEQDTLDWLKDHLTKVDHSEPIIVFTHHAFWSPFAYDPRNNLFCDVENPNDVLDMFADHNLVAVFSGHAHQNMEYTCPSTGTTFHISGAMHSGVENRDGSAPGYTIVECYSNRIETCYVPLGEIDCCYLSGQSRNPADRPPSLCPVGEKAVDAGQPLRFVVAATDPDGDHLTFSATNLPQGASFNSDTREFSWTPTCSQAGTYPGVHFEVDDGHLKDGEDITITVRKPVNNSPHITSTGAMTAIDGALYSCNVKAADPDSGEVLAYSLASSPTEMTIDSVTGIIQWTPTPNQIGDNKVVVQVTDQGGLFDTQSFTITVQASPQNGGDLIGGSQPSDDQIGICSRKDTFSVGCEDTIVHNASVLLPSSVGDAGTIPDRDNAVQAPVAAWCWVLMGLAVCLVAGTLVVGLISALPARPEMSEYWSCGPSDNTPSSKKSIPPMDA